MNYWTIRAFDCDLQIKEFVLISHAGSYEATAGKIAIFLRQKGYQIASLAKIGHGEYLKELTILKLKGQHPLVLPQNMQNTRIRKPIRDSFRWLLGRFWS